MTDDFRLPRWYQDDNPVALSDEPPYEGGGLSEAQVQALIDASLADLPASGGFYLDQLPLHPTHGDEFTAQALNTTLWTPRGRFNSQHAGLVGGTWLAHQLSGLTEAHSIYQPKPAKETYKVITAQSVHARTGTPVIGPAIVSATGTGLGIGFRPDENKLALYNLTSYYLNTDSSIVLSVQASDDFLLMGLKHWLMLEVVPTALDGDIFFMRYSLDGFNWSHSSSYNPADFTATQIGWGCHYVPVQTAKMAIDRFNVIEDYDVGNNLVRTPTSGTATYTFSTQLNDSSWAGANAADGTGAEWAMTNATDPWWQVAWSVGQTLNRIVFKERNGDTWGGVTHVELSDGATTHRYPVLDDVTGANRWRVVDFPTLTGITTMRLEGDMASAGGTNPGLVEIEAYLRS